MWAKLLGLLVIATAAYATWNYEHPVMVDVYDTVPVEHGSIDSKVTATGSCNTLRTVNVGAQISGVVTELYADYNSRVTQGQALALIDPGPLEVQLKEQQAALNSAVAAVTAAKVGVEQAKVNVTVAQQQRDSQIHLADLARNAEQLAKVEVDRSQKTADAGITSQEDLRSLKTNYDVDVENVTVAQMQVDTAAANIVAKQAAVEQAQAQLTDANAQVIQAQVNVDAAKVNLSRTKIVSPINGFVLSRNINQGETVTSSAVAPVLFQLVQNLDHMQIDVNLDESDVRAVKAGQKATFNVDAFPGQTFQATVRQVQEGATNVSNVISYDVVLDILPAGVEFLPGMTANITITTAHREDAIKMPKAAFRYRPDQGLGKRADTPASKDAATTVYKKGPDGKPVPIKLVLGIADGKYNEVVSGDVQPGDQVIVSATKVRK